MPENSCVMVALNLLGSFFVLTLFSTRDVFIKRFLVDVFVILRQYETSHPSSVATIFIGTGHPSTNNADNCALCDLCVAQTQDLSAAMVM
jgi:hypothetical protein